MKNAIVPSTLTATKKSEKKNQSSRLRKVSHSLNRILLNALWKTILHSTLRSREPKIWEKRDRNGNSYWVAYNPANNCTTTFSSEQGVRVWLDERYYL